MNTSDPKCATCGIQLQKWPLYYFGAGPNDPENAEVYFCGPHCATKYYRVKNGNTRACITIHNSTIFERIDQ